jgi:hypothetical protein
MNINEAYLNGFVKRAAEYGFSDDEIVELAKQAIDRNVYDLEEAKAGYLGNMLTASALGAIPPTRPGGELGGSVPALYNAYQDLTAEKDMPSRLLNITGGTFLGDVLGGAAGSMLSRAAGQTDQAALMSALDSGRSLGRALGAGLGARRYNQKIDELIEQTKQEQGW